MSVFTRVKDRVGEAISPRVVQPSEEAVSRSWESSSGVISASALTREKACRGRLRASYTRRWRNLGTIYRPISSADYPTPAAEQSPGLGILSQTGCFHHCWLAYPAPPRNGTYSRVLDMHIYPKMKI